MNVGKALRDHYLRIDARSLGLFRLTFGLVLLYDLLRRWRYIKDFYSNDGVLPNHNHLFNLHENPRVWSVLHAFSSVGENEFAFSVILVVYVCFLIGLRTRFFHLVSLVCLVSLTARNILLENAGNYAAIALLAFTAFLPLGSRFSLDSLMASFEAKDEKDAAELNDRPPPSQDALDAARAPGWTPTSLAALAVLAQIAIIYLVTAVQQKSPEWGNGTALHYALNSERWVSAAGASARGFLGPAALSLWTRVFRASEWAVPALIAIPFAWRVTRGVAAGLSLFYGLTLGVFFSFGLYGWTMAAAAFLLIPGETWNRIEHAPREKRARTVIYDADCGVCLLLARLLVRLDLRGDITLQGNDDLGALLVRGPDGNVTRAAIPESITPALADSSVIAVDHSGRVATRARAVAAIVQALPLGWSVAWIMRLPGIVNLLNVLYDLIATRRQRISELIGKGACGVDLAPTADAMGDYRGTAKAGEFPAVAPSTRLRRALVGSLREIAAAAVLWAMLGQTTHENAVPVSVPRPAAIAAVAQWPRMIGRWDVLVPEPPSEDEVLVVDAQTRAGRSVDPLTGREPEFDPGAMRGLGLGQLWSDYLYRIHEKEWFDFQRAFRDYIAKGGPNWDPHDVADNQITGLDAYWIKQPIPAPGQPRDAALAGRDKMFTQSRGGRLGVDRTLPLLRPDVMKRR